jgi:hypothetical protein
MSNRKHQDTIKIPGRYVAIRYEILDSPAWRATSFGARLLYIALHRRLIYKDNNNGRVHLSTREAAEALGARQMDIGVWYRELQHYGFIVMTNPPSLGVEGKGKAAHWRLTDWRYANSFDGTKDYLRWNGTPFPRPRRPVPKIGSRSTPRFRVKHPALHTPEAPRASGKPESEAPRASYDGGSPEAPRASSLDIPSHIGEAREGEGLTASPDGHDEPNCSDAAPAVDLDEEARVMFEAEARVMFPLAGVLPREVWDSFAASVPEDVLIAAMKRFGALRGPVRKLNGSAH